MSRTKAPRRDSRRLSDAESATFVTLKLGDRLIEGDGRLLKNLRDFTFSFRQKELINSIIQERQGANIANKAKNDICGGISTASSSPTEQPGTDSFVEESTTETFKVEGVVDNSLIEKSIMEQPTRPPLKLKISTIKQTQKSVQPQTPIPAPPPIAPRTTQTIKLKFGGSAASTPTIKTEADQIPSVHSSAKKRKRPTPGPDDEPVSAPKPPPIRKISLLTQSARPSLPVQTPVFKLKTKGKVPKRPLGVGYDSELEEREVDPTILEAFVLRMLPGPDADYIRDSIEKGTVGVSRLQGGADIRLRFLDIQGRRGVMFVRGNQYAISVVDLPTITEGMKSWDKKNFMKSVDISQMCLVLGPCKNDDEAKVYPLPADVNPKNYQYSHGLTAPMRNVRKRRFERTNRARIDDIEAIERKVQALLKADNEATETVFKVFDQDPRLQREQFSPQFDSEQDAEGEEEEDYFGARDGGIAQTPGYTATPAEDITAADVDEFTRLFEGGDDDEVPAANSHGFGNMLQPPEQAESSFAVTSASASPSATAAPTPAADADQSSDDDDEDEDEDADEERREGDDALQQVRDRIADLEQKIKENKRQLKGLDNQILKRKVAKKIQDLQADVATMRRNAGLEEEDADGD